MQIKAVFSSTANKVDPLTFFLSFVKLFKFTMMLNNNLFLRYSYCKSKMFNLILFKKRNRSDSVFRILRDLSYLKHNVFKFWIVSLMPMDNEFLNPIIGIQIWFTALNDN